MRFSIVSALLAGTAVQAFSDTSPFILFSTSKLALPYAPQLQVSKNLLATVSSLLSTCPTTHYALISQPNVHASDILDPAGKCHMPNLCRAVASEPVQAFYSVSEVVGQLGSSGLAEMIRSACAKEGKTAEVAEIEMKRLPALDATVGDREIAARQDLIGDNDYRLSQLLQSQGDSYTVLLFSDPNESQTYEPDFQHPVRMDLKRRTEPVYVGRRAGDSPDNRPLFAKYQFFTPGIFMAFVALFVMLSILGVGLRALASLEVSYGAFDKEMGPAAQKKQL